jgi:hypothetical protein
MSYHPTTHPIRRLFGRHGLGAIDQAGTGAMAGEYMTSLTPYNITPVQAQYVPSTVVTAMQAAGFPAGYVRSGWSDMGHIFVVFLPATGWTATQRRAALTSAIRAAERNIASDAKLLLPGETAPSGAAPTTAPPGTPTSVPSITAPSGRISGGTVGLSVPTSAVQSLLISKGYALVGGADNTFGTSTANALKLALSAIGRYVVLGGQVTTYTVSSDKHSIAFSSGTWEALQSAPNASGTAMTSGVGPDWGAIAPFLVGGGVLVAVGAFFLLKKKPRQKMTVRNPDRFRIFDAGPGTGDRYTIVDSKPNSYKDRPSIKWIDYFGFNEHPFHPQGIGMHGEMSMEQWGEHARAKFRALGKRIYLSDLTGDARKAAEQFMHGRGASKRSVKSVMSKNGRVRRNAAASIKMPRTISGMGLPERKTQPGPWKTSVARALEDKAWAEKTKNDQKWLRGASQISLEMLQDRLEKSVLELAKYHYLYWQMRANLSYGYNLGSATDPVARRTWIEAGGTLDQRTVKRNPVPHGYSRKTMGKIIGIERRAGKSPEQASAIAYSVARKAARKAGVRPSYLRNARGGR